MEAENPILISTASVMVMLPIHIPHLPERGAMVQARSSSVLVGGGFTMMSAARRQGVRVTLASPLGTGPNSVMVRHALDSEGIDILVEELVGDTGMCLALQEFDGHVTSVMSSGVEAEPQAGDLTDLDIRPGDWVYFSGADLSYQTSRRVLCNWAAELPTGVNVAFAPGPAVAEIPRDILLSMLPHCDLVTLNLRESAILANVLGPGDITEVLRRHIPRHCMLVRRLGARGCTAQVNADADEAGFAAFPVPIIDTTGVGDTHTGVLLAKLLQGRSLKQAVVWANAAAAVALSRKGAAPTPTVAEIDQVLTGKNPH